MPAKTTRASTVSRTKNDVIMTKKTKKAGPSSRGKKDPYPTTRPLRQSSRANRPVAPSEVHLPSPDGTAHHPFVPLQLVNVRPLALRNRKGPAVDLGMPTREEYAQLEEQYLTALDPRKQTKALISQAMFDEIWLVLHAPQASTVGSPQFRWWVRKMFALAQPEELDGDGPPVAALPGMVPLPVVVHDGKRVAIREQIFDILCVAHARVQHGGRDKTGTEVRQRYTWIPKDLIALFVKHCPTCNYRRTAKSLEDGDDDSTSSTPTEQSETDIKIEVLPGSSVPQTPAQYVTMPLHNLIAHPQPGYVVRAPLGPTLWSTSVYPPLAPGFIPGPLEGQSMVVPRWRFSPGSGGPSQLPGDYFCPPPMRPVAELSRQSSSSSSSAIPDIRITSAEEDSSKITLPTLSELFPEGLPPVHPGVSRRPLQRLRSNLGVLPPLVLPASRASPDHQPEATTPGSPYVPQIDPVLLRESSERKNGAHTLAIATEESEAKAKEAEQAGEVVDEKSQGQD